MLPSELNQLLKETSRSFHLTLCVLPRAVRPQISLAYLLARTTDTIADTEILPPEQRLQALRQLRDRIQGENPARLDFDTIAREQSSAAERELLTQAEESLRVLDGMGAADQRAIRKVLATITSGQELDLQRFQHATGERLIALQSDTELEDYTYRVAGCVGEFWTGICVQHLFALDELPELIAPHFQQLGVSFGKGLQMVNILRDLPVDLRNGRCYLPETVLQEIGLAPIDLLSDASEARLRPVYSRYLDQAEDHLAAGWTYTNSIPFKWMNLRLACAWPILIGLETIRTLRHAPVLDPRRRGKISRGQIWDIILHSIWYYPLQSTWWRLARFRG